MNKYPILTGTYNHPSPLTWFFLLFGLLLVGLAPVFYSIKPDDPSQLYFTLAIGLPMTLVGVMGFLRWGIVEIYEDKLRLVGKLRKSRVVEIPFSSVTAMNVLEGKAPGDNKLTYSVGGPEVTLQRVKPKNFAGFMWMAARFNDLLPVTALEGTPRRAKYKEWPEGLSTAIRQLKDENGKQFMDTGVLAPVGGKVVYIPVTNTTKGPGVIAILVSPITVTTTLFRKGMPKPQQLPLLPVLSHVWKAHKLTLAQKEAFIEALAINLMGSELESMPEVGVTVNATTQGYDSKITVQDKTGTRMTLAAQGF